MKYDELKIGDIFYYSREYFQKKCVALYVVISKFDDGYGSRSICIWSTHPSIKKGKEFPILNDKSVMKLVDLDVFDKETEECVARTWIENN